MHTRLTTPRLVVRRWRPEDWKDLQRYVSKPEVIELDSPYPTDDEGCQGVAAFFAGTPEFLAVEMPARGIVIGHLHYGPRGPERPEGWRNLGFIFDSVFWGQGLAFEACQALIQHAFEELSTPGFHTGTRAENARSLKLLARLGFQRSDPEDYVFDLQNPVALPTQTVAISTP